MHPLRRQRLFIVFFIVIATGLAAALMGYALRENINLFYPPSDIVAGKAPVGRDIRAGGMVLEGSVKRATDSLQVSFIVTDYQANVPVTYTGILPDLFSEGEGVVVSGQLDSKGLFHAEQVLAKHDEKYMPPEVSEALKKANPET
ncbi:cytochrome c maturation protein CcmE [Litorivivens sp.]|uniref:cytochrome c maturation protein CcmE n=2 Tax=Litorivivens sp. TaxID=2020868 RepID=UPI003569C9AE